MDIGKKEKLSQIAWKLVKSTIELYLLDPSKQRIALSGLGIITEKDIVDGVEKILGSANLSYRDVLIVQLSYALSSEKHFDLTQRSEGAREIGKKLGSFLAENHIPSVKDAYQNIGKNTVELARGNFQESDDFLRWASRTERTEPELRAIFQFGCAFLAMSSRPVYPFPVLDLASLTFGNVALLLQDVFSIASEGAYEQFAVAALLHAVIAQQGMPSYRVETKSLNATDKSSRAAGDIQVLIGNRVLEAYEVTANQWSNKISGVNKTIKDHDLSRLHIVAKIGKEKQQSMLGDLRLLEQDVSVLDVEEFCRALISVLTREYRRIALERFYQFLDRYQPVVDRVNCYVGMLNKHGLTASV